MQDDTTHTPGPWEVNENGVLTAMGGVPLGMILTTADRAPVAAAPDLLAALRHAYNVLATFHYEDETNEVMVQAWEAICKATGGEA